jgi:hypothetical protein
MFAYYENPSKEDLPILGRARELPLSVIEDFEELADAQRGEPEEAMQSVQWAHGGVLNWAVEHIGDITNRMAADLRWDSLSTAGDKIDKAYFQLGRGTFHNRDWITFGEEHERNVASNVDYHDVDRDDYERKLHARLERYVAAHRRLPVYNRAQWLARQAAIHVGSMDFDRAFGVIAQLKEMSEDEDRWWAEATDYRLGPDGRPLRYPWPELGD